MLMNLKKLTKGENSLNYYLALFFGVIKKILEIMIFIVPIQCISSVSDGKLSSRLKIIFTLLGFNNVNNENQIIFFSLLLMILVLSLYLNIVIKRVFINYLKRDKLESMIKNKFYKEKMSELRAIDNNIENNSILIFCIILLVATILYDYIIGTIILISGYLSILISRNISNKYLNNLEKNKVNKRFNKLIYKKGFLLRNFKTNILKSKFVDNKIVINTTVNVFTMFCIMYSIYFRKDINISIIYIFIIRIYLGRIKSVISNYFMKKVN